MITLQQFYAFFPGAFNSPRGGVSQVDWDATVQTRIDHASLEMSGGRVPVDETHWGPYFDLGMYYLTAHLVTTTTSPSAATGASGVMRSQSVDGVSISWASPVSVQTSLSSDGLSKTSYGSEYVRLRRKVQGGPVFVTPWG